MTKLRYRAWRHSITLGSGLIMLCFIGIILFREERWMPVLFELLLWTVGVVSVVFNVAVTVLKKIGLLEFTYTDKDRYSYLYNAEKMGQQMIQERRARRRN